MLIGAEVPIEFENKIEIDVPTREDSYYSNEIFSMKTRLLRENNGFL
jgi:hypothetical protein